jgi:23S rRNA (cytidine1920-2'-O)/16S rRNA (cytidine1409-2'-O)-methyltransferase
MRLDQKLVDLKFAPTKSQALHLIKEGLVLVNRLVETRGGKMISRQTEIQVLEPVKYVSRGAKKLLYALQNFNLSVKGLVCADFGASTGGFTQILLEKGASKIYSVDVGTDQLDPQIKANPKVIDLSQTNIRSMRNLPEKADFACIDLSFISLNLVLPKIIENCKPVANLVVLFKPQFEVGPENLNKKGIVNPEFAHQFLQDWISSQNNNNFQVLNQVQSPITGQDGNTEFLLHIQLLY